MADELGEVLGGDGAFLALSKRECRELLFPDAVTAFVEHLDFRQEAIEPIELALQFWGVDPQAALQLIAQSCRRPRWVV